MEILLAVLAVIAGRRLYILWLFRKARPAKDYPTGTIAGDVIRRFYLNEISRNPHLDIRCLQWKNSTILFVDRLFVAEFLHTTDEPQSPRLAHQESPHP
jgi:hypothetical protein